MTAAPHRLLIASAGTGKTYQLSSHFLTLLLRGVEPERILATTFTRKAAGEILDRVFERLLAASDPEAKQHARELDGLSDAAGRAVSAAECRDALVRAAKRIDRFEVRTLDAFFVRVARLFAFELGLPPGWAIADEIDDRDLRAEGVSQVLATGTPRERLELLRAVHRAAASRQVHEEMGRLVSSGRALLLESPPEAWHWDPPLEPLDEAGLEAAIRALAEVELPRDRKGAPKKSWQSARDRHVDAARQRDWSAFVKDGIAAKVLTGEERFSSAPIPDPVRRAIEVLLRHIAAEGAQQAARRTAAARRALEHFEVHYGARKRERSAYRFEDLPYAIAPLEGTALLGARADDVWLRLDGRIDHLLLDEFQDTSPAQWRALEPLASEILADGTGERSFFCVGDPKQSIYGWRQAEPRMLEGLATRWPVLEPECLDRSYRSAPVVLDAVNGIFEALPHLELFSRPGMEPALRAAERFAERFRPHESAHPDLPGAVAAFRPARTEEENGTDPVVELAADRVAALCAEAPEAGVGVLVRTNKRIPTLIDALRRRGIRASGEGGNPLTDAESVQVFLSALHLADHPGDTAAAFHVETSPLAASLGMEKLDGGAAREAAARALRTRLLAEGYGAVAAELLPHVERAAVWSAWDRRRFGQLVELAWAHDAAAGLRPADFARRVRETPVEDPTAARVRVMTVHRAKGLEFDAVILPELDASVAGDPRDYLWRRKDPFGVVDRVSVHAPPYVQACARDLRDLAAAHTEREVEESLCVLYVALTRARRRVELLLPPPTRTGRSTARDYANLLVQALGIDEPTATGLVWEQPGSAKDWARGIRVPAEAEAERPPERLELPPGEAPRALATRTPSAEEGGAPTARDLLRARRAASVGTLVHHWLEELVWLEDFEGLADEELLERARAWEPDPELRAEALRILRAGLRAPAIRELLGRPSDPQAWRVETEHPFCVVLPDESGAEVLWSGVIDRLVLRVEDGRVVEARVVDFKTDAVEADRIAERVEHYRPQLEAYRRAVAARWGLDPESVSTALVFLTPGEVVTVRGAAY